MPQHAPDQGVLFAWRDRYLRHSIAKKAMSQPVKGCQSGTASAAGQLSAMRGTLALET